MNLNYILLPEDYLPQPPPPPADTTDNMDVDEVPMGEPMEVDVVVMARPKRRVIRVTAEVLVPVGEPMDVDPVPAQPQNADVADIALVQPWLRPVWNVDAADYALAQPWPVLPRPAWNVSAADYAPAQPWPVLPRPAWNVSAADYAPAQPWPVLPRPAWNVSAADYAPAQPWPVLPRPARNIDMADVAKFSAALMVGGSRVSRRSPRKSKTTVPQPRPSPPSNPQMTKPVISAHPHVDMYKIATSSKVKVEDMPLLFESVETGSSSLNVARQVKGKEPATRCIKKTRFSSPLSPVKPSKLDDNLFVTSNRQSPDLITNNRWLKTSRTPGQNIHNESVFESGSDDEPSRLAAAYLPTRDADTLFLEIERFSPVRPVKTDEDFFLKSSRQTPHLAVNNRWLKISRTPDHNIYNESTTIEDNVADYSSLCMAYSPSEDTEDSLPEIDFAEADTSLNWAPGSSTPETPHRIRRMKLFSPFSPVRQCKLDDDDLFITSKRQTADLITNNGWLKTSRTPGRNIHNESVFIDNEYADYSYLAHAYPSVEDSDTSFDEDYSSASTSLVSDTSGYLADDSFSFIKTPCSSSSSLASDDSFGYLADVSCSSFADLSEVSYASCASMADEEIFHPSCETVSEAASQANLSGSTSMDFLIASMSNLTIDEGSGLEEGIVDERTISEDSIAWKTAEETAPRDDSENVVDATMESLGDDGSETTQSGHDWSTEEDSFDSHYPSSLSSGDERSCSCGSYTSYHVNLSGIDLSGSSGSDRPGTEAELLEDVGSLAVEEFRWECDEAEEDHENEEEDDSGNGNQLDVELGADAEVNDEDHELLGCHDLFDHGNETELDVSELDDDLKYIYTLPY